MRSILQFSAETVNTKHDNLPRSARSVSRSARSVLRSARLLARLCCTYVQFIREIITCVQGMQLARRKSFPGACASLHTYVVHMLNLYKT